MSKINLQDYYDRFDPNKNYTQALFRDTRALQGAELNELQRMLNWQMRGLAEALFKDGDIIREARVEVKEGVATCASGLVYLAGAVRQVPPSTLTVPPISVVAIGVFLSGRVITELEDSSLYNPAIGTRSEGEPGAARWQETAQWGLSTDTDTPGDFYPVHTLEDGELLAKAPPPNLDSVTQALARYDRDSAGGTYVVSGFRVMAALDDDLGRQVYTVSEGRAQVFGYPVELTTSRRLVYAATPDLLDIEAEPHLSTSVETQTITLNRYPAAHIKKVRLIREVVATITHGGFTGAHDPLPEASVTDIIEVKQGEMVFAAGSDYKLTAGKVDWSLSGQEPSPYSTYEVTYRFMAVDSDLTVLSGNSFELTGAVVDTQIFVDYSQKLPRLDRLGLTREGAFVWTSGVAAEWEPQLPQVSPDVLPLATIHQSWDAQRRVVNDGVRTVPMDEIAAMNVRMDAIVDQVAQQRLASDAITREAGAKKGLFVDPFLGDAMRDQGLEQQAAITGGVLTLPVLLKQVAPMPQDLTKPKVLEFTPVPVLEQLARTGSMLVNPYSALDPLPAIVVLTPAVDRWTDVETIWTSSVTNIFGSGNRSTSSSSTEVFSSSQTNLEFLRQIAVAYRITGFGPEEEMTLTFDGLPIIPTQKIADGAGVVVGSFTIPAKIPAGAKTVAVRGAGGSTGSAVFVGQGTLTIQTLRTVTNTTLFWHDPLAQTFALTELAQVCGVDLWFTAKHTSRVIVQVRETTVGIPNQVVLGEAILSPEEINLGGQVTRVIFNSPVALSSATEYSLVVMCDDSITALSVAELGKWDTHGERWVTAQPYQVGVLLSSSNASTWTPHQDRDLTFRLLKAQYETADLDIDLGQITLEDSTDLMLMAMAEQPTAQSRVEYRLTLPTGETLAVADRQPVRLNGAVTGEVSVKAHLKGTAGMSPVVYPGAQLVAGAVTQSADYITRAIPAGAGSRVRIILDADLPSGSKVETFWAVDGQSTWAAVEFQESHPLDEGWQEMIYETTTDDLLVRIKLVLTGTSLARPRVDNLRVMTI